MGHPKNCTLFVKLKRISQSYEYTILFRLIYSTNILTLWQPTFSIIRRYLRQVLERANILHKLNSWFCLHGFNFHKQWTILSIPVFCGSNSDTFKGSDFLIFNVYGRSNFFKMSEHLFSSPANHTRHFEC